MDERTKGSSSSSNIVLHWLHDLGKAIPPIKVARAPAMEQTISAPPPPSCLILYKIYTSLSLDFLAVYHDIYL